MQQQDDYANEIELEKLLKPKLYSFPDWDTPVAVFDFEDLENTESLLVLCVRKDQGEEYREENVCYVWTGPDFDISDHADSTQLNENQFVQKCMDQYWGAENIASSSIKIANEQPDSPSEAFQHFFD